MPGTSEGLTTTLDLLSKTENEASVRVLVGGLDSCHRTIRDGAVAGLLKRRSSAGHREVIRRLHTLDEYQMGLLREHRVRLRQAPRDAILDTDRQMCANGCRTALWLAEYDLIPTMITALEDPANPNAGLVAGSLRELVEHLYRDLSRPDSSDDRRDPRLLRRHVITALEESLGRFARHERREVVEAFLLLVSRDNAVLKQILQDPHCPAFKVVIDVLSKSSTGGVIRLLLGLLDDPHAPSAVLGVIAKRSDLKFIRYLLRKIGRNPSVTSAQNLKRIHAIAWLQSGPSTLDQLDEAAQHGAVRLVMASAIPRLEAFNTIEHLALRGKREGRRAASEALAEFHGAAANALALKVLEDEDPQVQANVLLQLRRRGIPGALPKMVDMLESRHAIVRQAARRSLSEFTFDRFLGAFDMLDEDVRKSTGALVKKVDPGAMRGLRAELQSKARSRRLRALTIARTLDVVEQFETRIIELLGDEDHMVRAEAALALAGCVSQPSHEALVAAQADRSETVRRAVRSSLAAREEFSQWLGQETESQD